MALNAITLATSITTALNLAMVDANPLSAAGLAPYHASIATAVANAVVAHLTSNAAVVVTVVTACPAGAGTGTGTGTVT